MKKENLESETYTEIVNVSFGHNSERKRVDLSIQVDYEELHELQDELELSQNNSLLSQLVNELSELFADELSNFKDEGPEQESFNADEFMGKKAGDPSADAPEE